MTKDLSAISPRLILENEKKETLKGALKAIKNRDPLDDNFCSCSSDERIENIKYFFSDIPYKTLFLFPDFVLDDLEKCSNILKKTGEEEYHLGCLSKADIQEKSDCRERIALLKTELKEPYQRLRDYYKEMTQEADNA